MHNTEGLILKRIDVGESDSLFTIYTKDFGKIRARAQGVKKEGAKLKGHLETLSHANISFVIGKNGERLTGATLLNFWPKVRADFSKAAAAYYIAEIVDRGCLGAEKDSSLWEFLIKNLGELEDRDFSASSLGEFLDAFEDEFLAVLGYAGEKNLDAIGVSTVRPSVI